MHLAISVSVRGFRIPWDVELTDTKQKYSRGIFWFCAGEPHCHTAEIFLRQRLRVVNL